MHPWVRDFLLIRHQIMGWGWTSYIICTGQQLKEEAREFIERKRSRAFFVPFRLRLSPFNTRPEYRDYAYLYVRIYIQFNFAVMGDFRKRNEPVDIVVQLSCETVAPTHAPSRHVRWPILFFMRFAYYWHVASRAVLVSGTSPRVALIELQYNRSICWDSEQYSPRPTSGTVTFRPNADLDLPLVCKS